MPNPDLSPFWNDVRQLFAEQHFMTIVCGFAVIIITARCYRYLKGISPALVPVVFLLALFVLVLHWSQTRTEPTLLKPAMDVAARYLPKPGNYHELAGR